MADKRQLLWSPEQIAGWLKHIYPDDTSSQVSHETIYRSLFIQARGALKKELLAHFRRTRVMRHSRHHTQKTDNHGRIIDTVSISVELKLPLFRGHLNLTDQGVPNAQNPTAVLG